MMRTPHCSAFGGAFACTAARPSGVGCAAGTADRRRYIHRAATPATMPAKTTISVIDPPMRPLLATGPIPRDAGQPAERVCAEERESVNGKALCGHVAAVHPGGLMM